MPTGFYKLYIKAFDLIEISYFYVKFGDFLSECFMNMRKFYEKQNSHKENFKPVPYETFHINNMLDIFDHLENNFIPLHFYLIVDDIDSIETFYSICKPLEKLMMLSQDYKMRLMLVSNFDVASLDLKINENMDFSCFTKIFFPRASYEDIESIIDNNLSKDIENLEQNYLLSRLDKIYKITIPGLGHQFHNLNDMLYHMRNNVEFASYDYIRKEKRFNALQASRDPNYVKTKPRKDMQKIVGILKNEMLFQINNSIIHLKDAIIKEESDDLDEYNQAFKRNISIDEKTKGCKNKKKNRSSSSKEKNKSNDNSDDTVNIESSTCFIFDKPIDKSNHDNKKTFYELNSNLYKNKSTLNSLCNIKEHSTRLINSLSTTQKILMIAAFIASELDPSKDSIFLRGVKRTMTYRRKNYNLKGKSIHSINSSSFTINRLIAIYSSIFQIIEDRILVSDDNSVELIADINSLINLNLLRYFKFHEFNFPNCMLLCNISIITATALADEYEFRLDEFMNPEQYNLN